MYYSRRRNEENKKSCFRTLAICLDFRYTACACGTSTELREERRNVYSSPSPKKKIHRPGYFMKFKGHFEGYL